MDDVNESVQEQWTCGACRCLHIKMDGVWQTYDGDIGGLDVLGASEDRCSCGAPRPSQPSILQAELEAENAALHDALHPNGRCTCAGEGKCDWCKRTEMDEYTATVSNPDTPPKNMTQVYCRLQPIPEGGEACNCLNERFCFAAAMGYRQSPPEVSLGQMLSEIQCSIDTARQRLNSVTFGNLENTALSVRSCMNQILKHFDKDY